MRQSGSSPLTQHKQSSEMSPTPGSDEDSQWVLIYNHSAAAKTYRGCSAEAHTKHQSIETAIHKPYITKLLGAVKSKAEDNFYT